MGVRLGGNMQSADVSRRPQFWQVREQKEICVPTSAAIAFSVPNRECRLHSLPAKQKSQCSRGSLTGMSVLPQSAAKTLRQSVSIWLMLGWLLLPIAARGAERVTLQSGFDLLCDHRVADGAMTRLFFDGGSANYIDVATTAIRSEEPVADATKLNANAASVRNENVSNREVLTSSELHEVLQGAGTAHDLDVDLLASVVHAESGNRVHARSHAGAEGLMQLMPGTAAQLGVRDVFSPKQNVGGGAAYLDALLTRYHGNVAWALAAYNAGPGAVDRWHGVPPYRETRAYVARIIHEFNGRYTARLAAEQEKSAPPTGQRLPGDSRVQAHAGRVLVEPQTALADVGSLSHRSAEGESPR